MNLAGVAVGEGQTCKTIAEISNNHNGSLDRAKRLITAAKEAGADFVKFQCYTANELVELRGDGPAPEPWGSDGWTMQRLYEKACTPHEWFPELIDHVRMIGIPWFSSVFGRTSLALLEQLDCPAYKIAALDFAYSALRMMVEATDKPVLRSYSGPWPVAENMLYCPPGYPQPRAHLGQLAKLPAAGPRYLGYSYHGTSSEVPALAALCGAKLIEVHFQLADEPSELEANISLDESQFAGMIGRIRHYETLL